MCGCGRRTAAQPDKRITFLGRGAEVGWPRWSPDGKTVLLDGARKRDGASVIYAIGVDQESGAVTSELREVRGRRLRRRDTHAEWLRRQATVVGDREGRAGPSRDLHAAASPAARRRSCIASRPSTTSRASACRPMADGVAFVAPATDGYLPDLPEGDRRRCAADASDDRSLAQDAAGLVARRSRASRSRSGATTRRSGRSTHDDPRASGLAAAIDPDARVRLRRPRPSSPI